MTFFPARDPEGNRKILVDIEQLAEWLKGMGHSDLADTFTKELQKSLDKNKNVKGKSNA